MKSKKQEKAEQKSGIRVNMKHFLSMLLCIGIMMLFCFLMNGRLGLYVALLLALAMVISAILTWATVKQVEISFVSRNEIVNKGDTVDVDFTVSKKTWLPTPFIEISLSSQGNLEPVTPEKFRIAMGFSKKKSSYSVKYLAKYCTAASVELNMPEIIDYMGVFTARVGKLMVSGDGVCRFGIIPMIHEINQQNELLRICCDASAYDDNAEETDESATIGSGVPGYEHREYVPGDPIKRINWKLSTKRDIYMIRLDEKLAAMSQGILFELSDERKDSGSFSESCDIITEAALSMAALMLKQGLRCDVYCQKGGWQCYEITNEGELTQFQTALADYEPDSEASSLPTEELESRHHRVVMYFTNRKGTLSPRVEELRQAGCEVYTVGASQYADDMDTDCCYSVNSDIDFTRIK